MSVRTDHKSFIAPILSQNTEPENDTLALCDVSSRDKPWDKHRKNADIIADYYEQGGMDQYAQRVSFCSRVLDFKLVPNDELGQMQLKLSSAKFCRVRHCPVCQWRRSLRWKAKAYKALPMVIEDYPKYRWLFLTLTLKNCELTELRQTLDHMNASFRRLTERKAFPGVGWIKSVEVTRGRDGKSAHPHIHCLMMVKPSFFKKHYLSQKKWVALWKGCLRVDYQPMLDVQAIKPQNSPVTLLSEILKYQTKESDLIADRDWFLEYSKQMHKTRAVSVGGELRRYFSQLEEDPEDLIGESEEEEEDNQPDEGHLYFGWKRREQKYRMIDHKPCNTQYDDTG